MQQSKTKKERTSGYGGFQSYGYKAYTTFAPGISSVDQKDRYYSCVTEENPDGDKVLENYTRYSTIKHDKQENNVKKGDYKVPFYSQNPLIGYEVSANPQLLKHTGMYKQLDRRGQGQADAKFGSALRVAGQTVSKNVNPTCNWTSIYKGNAGANLHSPERTIAQRTDWSIPRQGYCSLRGQYTTEKGESYMKPSKIVNKESTVIPINMKEQTEGTAKRSFHPPGYTGFIPKIEINKNALRQSQCELSRNTIDKTNISHTYPRRLVGYAGHSPGNAINDRGILRPSCLSLVGEQFC